MGDFRKCIPVLHADLITVFLFIKTYRVFYFSGNVILHTNSDMTSLSRATGPSAAAVVSNLRQGFSSGKTKSYGWRINQLQQLSNLLRENDTAIKDALYKDLKKPAFETELYEIDILKTEIDHAMNNLKSWMKPKSISRSLLQVFDTVYMQKEPFGVVLVMGTWNYPLQLFLNPFVGVIAAGNCALLKPSEIATETGKLVAQLIPQYMDGDCIQVMQGGIPETTEILQERFDYIAFTGSTKVGKIVMSAAAKFLTPVLLELGGKSPVYVDEDSDLHIVANRIIWGKCCNAGQTCIAPDYVLCHKKSVDNLIDELKSSVREFYGEDPQKSESYGRIVSSKHFNRLVDILQKMPKEKLVLGGNTNAENNYIEPTIFKDVDLNDKIMEDEIFGPLLPILSVSDSQQAIKIINSREKPLAIYIFSQNEETINNILENTSAGGVLINDTLFQAGVTNVPFGGVGYSGMGSFHGEKSFETFTHLKPVWKRQQNMEALIQVRYPPYTEKNLSLMKHVMAASDKTCNIL